MKKKTKEREIEFGEFIVRITPHLIDIETKSKDWKIQVSNKTKEYGFICYLVNNEDMITLETQVIAMYHTRMVATSGEFCKMFMELVKEYINSERQAEVSEKDDAKILAEEKVMALRNPEAILELEKLKKESDE